MAKFLKNLDSKKGLVGGALGQSLTTLFVLFISGILVYAFALAGGEMKNATDDATAIDVINKTVAGAENFANFSPTLWIMVGIGMLLVIIVSSVGVFLIQRN